MRSSSYYSIPSNRTKKALNAPKVSKSKYSSSDNYKKDKPLDKNKKWKSKMIKQKRKSGVRKIYRSAIKYARCPSSVSPRKLSLDYGIKKSVIKKIFYMFSDLFNGRELKCGPPTKKVKKVLKIIDENGTQQEIQNALNSISGYLIKNNTIEEHILELKELANKYDLEIEPIIPTKKIYTLKLL